MSATSSTSTRPPLESVVRELYDEMAYLFGMKFIDLWAHLDESRLLAFWTNELRGLTPRELERGRQMIRSLDWPPSLPAFVKLCRPPADPVAAYYEAVAGVAARRRGERGLWSHPAIFWASVAVSAHDLEHVPHAQIRARWEKALEAEYAKREWDEIPAPPLSLPAPVPTSNAEAAKVLKTLGADKALAPKTDHKRWAKRLVARAEAGDKTVVPLALKWAREALA